MSKVCLLRHLTKTSRKADSSLFSFSDVYVIDECVLKQKFSFDEH